MREVPDFYNPDREAEEPYRREKEWQRWELEEDMEEDWEVWRMRDED